MRGRKSNVQKEKHNFERFEKKVWLESPTMHEEELQYVKEAYDTNWMKSRVSNYSRWLIGTIWF